MADYVVSAVLVDGISDPANAAAAAMDKAADSADSLTAAVTRVGPSAATLMRRYDDTTASALALQKAQTLLAQATDTMNIAVAEGRATDDQRVAVLGTLQAKVAGLRDATAATLPVTAAMAQGQTVAATAATGAAMAHAGFTRELVIMGHEVVTGNYSRIPGSMMVLAERTGNLNGIISTLGGLVFGWPGLFAAGAAALGVLAYSSNSAEEKLLSMQTALRATRDDFVSMAAEAQAAARSVGTIPGFSAADTRTAAQVTAGAPDFTGTQQQLANLIRVEGDLATVMGQTLPEAAKAMAAAMMDPGAEADRLAKEHFPGMTQALDDQIKAMQASGDTAGAFGQVLGVISKQVSGAATTSKTELQQAIENLGRAFTNTGDDGKTMGKSIADSVKDAAAETINAVAAIIGAVNSLRNSGGSLPGATAGSGSSIVVPPAAAGALPAAVANQIYSIAEQQNFGGSADVSALEADFATRVAQQESGGQQFGPGGGVLTSSAGAMGIMGLMPNTAAGLGVDATDPTQNITGGLQQIAHLWSKYGGNPALVAMAYNWGEGNVDALLAGTKTLAQVPKETQNYVQSVAGISAAGAVGAGLGTFSGVPGLPLPPPLPPELGGPTGVTNRPTDQISQALAAADKSSTAAGGAQAAAAQIELYQKALADLAAEGDTSSASVTKISEALQKAQVDFINAVPIVQKLTTETAAQTAGENEIAAAWANGAGAAQDAADHVKAEAQARKDAIPGTAQYAAEVDALTASYRANTAAQQQVTGAQQINSNNDQLSYLKAETSTLGESADARARELATMKEQQALDGPLNKLSDAQKQTLLDQAAAIASATTELQRQQAAWNEIGNVAGQIADQIGQSISNAFINGNGAAINFGNIARAALASVVTEALKLAIINPLMNAAFGTSSVTLGAVASALGSSSGGSGSSGNGILGLLSDGSSVAGLAGNSGLLSSLGITGNGGLLSSLGISGSSLSGAAGLLGTAAIGFGAGALVGNAVSQGVPQRQDQALIGAGLGALAGTFLIPIPIVGSLAGGLLGGLAGGLIGPGPKNPYEYTDVGLGSNGLLTQGKSLNQVDGSNESSTAQDINTINTALQALGATITSVGGLRTVGYGRYATSPDLASAFPDFRFAATDPTLNAAITGKSFASLTDLENLGTFLESTVPALLASVNNVGTLQPALAAVTASFGPAIAQAQAYGTATDALTAAQTKATAAINDAVTAQITSLDQGFQSNYLSAAATISGNPADALTAQLYTFDAQAQQQTAALKSQLTGIYGDSYTTTAAYADQMAQLENSLGEQRLAIQQQYNDRLTATATGAITSLTAEVNKLESSNASPLSPQAQYALASSQFSTTATAAAGGDFTSLSNLPGAADTFLADSRQVNGSGAQYALDFQTVLNAIGQAATATPDTLTASVLQAETRTQTQQLQDSLADLGTKLDAIKSQLAQGSATPARLTGS